MVNSRHAGRVIAPVAFVAGLAAAFVIPRLAPHSALPAPSPVLMKSATIQARPLDRDRVRFQIQLELEGQPPAELSLHFAGAHLEGVTLTPTLANGASVELRDPETIVIGSGASGFLSSATRFEVIDRPSSRTFGWGYEVGRFAWINDFGVAKKPGAWLETDIAAIDGLPVQPTGGADHRCGAAPNRSCRDFGYGKRQLLITLGRTDDRLALGVLVGVVALALLGFAATTRKALLRLVETHGEVDPDAPLPDLREGMYREAPIRRAAPRVLPGPLRLRFVARAARTSIAAMTSIAAVAYLADGHAPIRMPFLVAAWSAGATLVGCASLASNRVRGARAFAVATVVSVWMTMDDPWLAAGLVPLAIAGTLDLFGTLRGRADPLEA